MKFNRSAIVLMTPLAILATAVVMPGAGCSESKAPVSQTKKMADNAMPMAVATIGSASGAATQPSNQHVTGTVTFTQEKNGVKAVVDLTGLWPG